MTTKEFFKMAVKLVEANIQAGQYTNTMNLETITYDQTIVTFQALERAWSDINADDENVH